MAKITLIGAGGVIFAQNFIKDILLSPLLRDSEINLMDIDPGRLQNAESFLLKMSEELGITPNMAATTDLRKALHEADYVITIFRPGTLEHQRIEQSIPRKYGVDQVVADTLGPGGVFRGLRTLKPLFSILDAMEDECPGAYLLNYVNPMSINTIALSARAKTVRVIGLCHSVQSTETQLAEYISADKNRLSFLAAGVNHQAFFIKFEMDGRNAYPVLKRAMETPEIYNRDRVRFEIFRHFGYFPTESSGHNSEYVPYIRKRRELVEKFCGAYSTPARDGFNPSPLSAGHSGASLEICAAMQKRNEIEIQKLLSGEKPFDLEPSKEYAVQIIAAVESNATGSANLNIVNKGIIPNLPAACSVEVPCLINGCGIFPCRIEGYPEQLAALNRGMANVQMLAAEGALSGDRAKIFQAIALDPLTAAVCSLDEISSMTDELFSALESEIPENFS